MALLDEEGRSEAAIDCLRRALHAATDYADALSNLALLLQRKNKHAEAAEYWRRYLANDAQSEWAARARRSDASPRFELLTGISEATGDTRSYGGIVGGDASIAAFRLALSCSTAARIRAIA